MKGAEVGLMQFGDVNSYRAVEARRKKLSMEAVAAFVAAASCLAYISIVVIPVLAVAVYSGAGGLKSIFNNKSVLASIKVSLTTTSISLLLTFCLGTPAAFFIKSSKRKIAAKIIEAVTGLPVVLPPAVAGLSLLLVFGRSSPIGSFLDTIGVEIIFMPSAVILAQFFVSSGFYIQMLGTGIGMVEKEIYEVSYTLGAGKIETFFKVVLPIIKRPAIAGLTLSWTRSMGEFGATIVFAGNVGGVTRTMPLEIYTLMQTNIAEAAAVSMLLVIISFFAMFAIKVWSVE